MSDYIIFGKKGDGKSLVSVGRMRGIMLAGHPVATNLDLRLEHLLPPGLRNVRCYRLPDRPSIDDLKLIGRGSDFKDESTFGGLFLDECATMLNSRTFNDKGRSAMLDWFVHSRKLGWVTHFICQNPIQIDKQVREGLADLMVCCRRLDKVRIPFLGVITKFFGFEVRPPAIHVATVRYGVGNDAMVSDRWTYTATSELKASYDTNQIFQDNYPHGLYSFLSPWHLSCVAVPPPSDFVGPIRGPIDYLVISQRVAEKKWNKHMTKYFAVFFAVGLLFGIAVTKYWGSPAKAPLVASGSPVVAGEVVAPAERKYSETLTGKGVFKVDGVVTVLLSDGSSVTGPKSFTSNGAGWEAEISEGVWVKGAAQ